MADRARPPRRTAIRTRSRSLVRSLRRPSSFPSRLLPAAVLLFTAPARAIGPGEQVYSVAMHQHGSMSEGAGSMEWHADKAQQANVDVIWWTDHDWRVEHWRHMKRYDFESSTIDALQRKISEPDDAYPGEYRSWSVLGFPALSYQLAIVDSLAHDGVQSLRIEAWDSFQSPAFRAVRFVQKATRKQSMYSLARRVRLRFAVFPEVLDPQDGKFVLEVRLSEHPLDWPVLRYVIGSMEGEGTGSFALPYQMGQWNAYDVDVTADAIQTFTAGGADSLRGEDNSLYEVSFSFETRLAHQPVFFFDAYVIESDETLTGDDLLGKTRDFAALYETMYPAVSHYVGTEISRYRAQPHLNAYAPGLTFPDYTGHGWADSLYWAVDQVHAQGGVVSLNHVYGTGGYGDQNETPEQKAARIETKKRGLIAIRAYGVDIFEAGYRIRHGIDLAGFLDTWDALTGNAVFLTGNGVSDSHGRDVFDGWGPWQPGNIQFENNFVTWLYATEASVGGFVAALLGGRAFFGDPYAFDPDGTLDLWTGEGFPMGRIVLTDRANHDVVVEIAGLPAGAEVRFLQGEIRENPPGEYLDVNFLRDEILAGTVTGGVFTDTVQVDTTLPSFVRVEARTPEADLVFSNPIHFVRDVPQAGIPPARLAAVLGEVRILRADAYTLTGATYEASPAALELWGDEDVAGLGTLVIDTGVLGEPSAVVGGGTTSTTFQNGILTLVGFSGSGSVTQILWGAVDAALHPERIAAVSLDVGSPNPFGRGTVAKFALPRSATVFLEVLDVTGRRVRLLLDGRQEEGRHRVAWDGTDAVGRPVANGVYFFRLTTLGERLTTKAVKIR